MIDNIESAVLFSLIGIVTFIGGFFLIDRFTPYHLWSEIIDKQNTALAIVVGFGALGISVIIAAAMH